MAGSMLGMVGLSYLWRGVVPDQLDSALYATLKAIYIRLHGGENPGVLIPKTITNIHLVLQSPQHAPHVKCVLYHVLKCLCVSESIARLFIKWDLLKLLQKFLEEWTCRISGTLSPCEILLLDSQLALLENLSYHHEAFITDFIQLDFLKRLCILCRPQCLATYGYGAKSFAALHMLTDGVHPGLIGKTWTVCKDFREKAYQECFGEGYNLLNLPLVVLSVALYDTSGETDRDIAVEMLARKGTWPLMEDVVPGMKGSSLEDEMVVGEPDWRDVYVSSIVDGCRFWAQLHGKESTSIIQKIDTLLSGMTCKLPLHKSPLVGMILAIRDPVIGYYRGQVTAVHDEVVDVHALDYGCRKTVTWRSDEVFEIVKGMGLEQYEPQATLCILKGVSPPPLRPATLQSVAVILRNLAAEANPSFEAFGTVDIIYPLQYLVACPDPVIVQPAAQAISNMASGEIVRCKLNNQHTLSILMVKMKEYFYSLTEEPIARATYSILGAINNLLCTSLETREEFYMNKGLQHMIQLIGVGAPEQVQTAARRVVAMFVGNAVPTTVIRSVREKRNFTISKTARVQVEESMASLGIGRIHPHQSRGGTSLANSGASTEQPTKGISAALKLRTATTSTSKAFGEESNSSIERQAAITDDHITEGAESDAELLSSLVGKNRIARPSAERGGGDSSDGEILASLARPFTAHGENGALGLNTAVVYKKFSKKYYYVKGRQVDFQCDLTHDIRPFENVQKISRMQIMKAICGLLNSGEGGSVYMGISQKGIVMGISVDRDQRDVLRGSVDLLLTSVKPIVPCQMYNVHYHQVVEYIEETGDYTPLTDDKVIEIKVQPPVDMIHTLPNGEIMLRIGNKTEEISIQDLHVRTVLEAEERKLSEIETLEKELSIWTGVIT